MAKVVEAAAAMLSFIGDSPVLDVETVLLETAVAPFLAPLKMRVERRQDLANILDELLLSWGNQLKQVDKVNGSSGVVVGKG